MADSNEMQPAAYAAAISPLEWPMTATGLMFSRWRCRKSATCNAVHKGWAISAALSWLSLSLFSSSATFLFVSVCFFLLKASTSILTCERPLRRMRQHVERGLHRLQVLPERGVLVHQLPAHARPLRALAREHHDDPGRHGARGLEPAELLGDDAVLEEGERLVRENPAVERAGVGQVGAAGGMLRGKLAERLRLRFEGQIRLCRQQQEGAVWIVRLGAVDRPFRCFKPVDNDLWTELISWLLAPRELSSDSVSKRRAYMCIRTTNAKRVDADALLLS